MSLVIRHPRPDEELGPFFDMTHCPFRLNLEQVYVADWHGRLVGIALVFDGGHDIVMVDFVRAINGWAGRGIWTRLLLVIEADMRAQGKRLLMGYANSPRIEGLAHRVGATLGPQHYRALSKVLYGC